MTDVSDEILPEWTDEELAVLRSADDDAPPSRSLSATLAAVGVGGALASGAAAAKGASLAATTSPGMAAAKWTGFVAATKLVGVVALSSAVVGGGVVLVQRAEKARATAEATKQVHVAMKHVAEPVAATPPEPVVEEAPAPVTAAAEESAANPSSARAPAVRSQPDISLEIAALDAARSALRGGRTAEALAALDRYDAGYAKAGSLRVEATALRIEALLRSGKRVRATSLANAFLARNPKSPYAARVRALIGETSTNR